MFVIVYRQSVAKELRAVPAGDRKKIFEKIKALAKDPNPPGSVKLHMSVHQYRIRQGDYRIIYQIENQVLRVIVIKIGHRSDIYRNKK